MVEAFVALTMRQLTKMESACIASCLICILQCCWEIFRSSFDGAQLVVREKCFPVSSVFCVANKKFFICTDISLWLVSKETLSLGKLAVTTFSYQPRELGSCQGKRKQSVIAIFPQPCFVLLFCAVSVHGKSLFFGQSQGNPQIYSDHASLQ